jgi:hypothetical protein
VIRNGKEPADGIGGAVKMLATKASLEEQILNYMEELAD